MKERPILFTGEMVRAILNGRKTQARRPFKFRETNEPPPRPDLFNPKHVTQPPPLGTIGDRLWVRETWGLMSFHDPTDWCGGSIKGVPESELREQFLVEHAANWKLPNESSYWRPSIHMPRWASRINLEITAVRVERVQEITDFDAFQEGAKSEAGRITGPYCMSFSQGFRTIWQSIYGNWDTNPWVWVYEFRRIKP